LAVTLKDIAEAVGVKKSTVSVVLNHRSTRIAVSDSTKNRIFSVARELGYHPNAAARALTTRRTGHIGFILSDTIAEAWANAYYAECLLGVEKGCHRKGYGLNISTYNLSNLETFVFPPKVGQRTVDGLILADFVQAGVLEMFRKFEIPFVCIGDDFELPGGGAPSVVTDCVSYMVLAFEHLARLGHKRIAMHLPCRRRAQEWGEEIFSQARERPSLAGCEWTPLVTPQLVADYSVAPQVLDVWQAIPASKRPTALVGGYQVILGTLRELQRRGLRCPKDLSLISGFDLPACEFTTPSVTSVRQDMLGAGELAAGLLIDHLEDRKELENRRYFFKRPATLLARESSGPPSGMNT
jgi:DNA-binding LacI/PurR family transcriptional regulator